MRTDEGLVGLGEATLEARPAALAAPIRELGRLLKEGVSDPEPR